MGDNNDLTEAQVRTLNQDIVRSPIGKWIDSNESMLQTIDEDYTLAAIPMILSPESEVTLSTRKLPRDWESHVGKVTAEYNPQNRVETEYQIIIRIYMEDEVITEMYQVTNGNLISTSVRGLTGELNLFQVYGKRRRSLDFGPIRKQIVPFEGES